MEKSKTYDLISDISSTPWSFLGIKVKKEEHILETISYIEKIGKYINVNSQTSNIEFLLHEDKRVRNFINSLNTKAFKCKFLFPNTNSKDYSFDALKLILD